MTFIFNVLNLVAIVFLLALYIACFVGVFGSDDDERHPGWSVVSVAVAYLAFMFLKEMMTLNTAVYIWLSLNSLSLILLLSSFFNKKESNLWIDVFSVVGTIVIGILPVLYLNNSNLIPVVFNYGSLSFEWHRLFELLLPISILLMVLIQIIEFRRQNLTSKKVAYKIDYLREEIERQKDQVSFNAYYKDGFESFLEELKEVIKTEQRRNNSKGFSKQSQSNRDERVARELEQINQKLDRIPDLESDYNINDVLRDIKHSMTTPFSQIMAKCKVIGKENDAEAMKTLVNQIGDTIQLCQSIISSYMEMGPAGKMESIIGMRKGLETAFQNAANENCKFEMTFDAASVPESIGGYSSGVLLALMSPLIENAVAASPQNGMVEVDYKELGNSLTWTISNICEGTIPSIEQLKTVGYSSKHERPGVGLQTTRAFLRLLKGEELGFERNGNRISVIVRLRKK